MIRGEGMEKTKWRLSASETLRLRTSHIELRDLTIEKTGEGTCLLVDRSTDNVVVKDIRFLGCERAIEFGSATHTRWEVSDVLLDGVHQAINCLQATCLDQRWSGVTSASDRRLGLPFIVFGDQSARISLDRFDLALFQPAFSLGNASVLLTNATIKTSDVGLYSNGRGVLSHSMIEAESGAFVFSPNADWAVRGSLFPCTSHPLFGAEIASSVRMTLERNRVCFFLADLRQLVALSAVTHQSHWYLQDDILLPGTEDEWRDWILSEDDGKTLFFRSKIDEDERYDPRLVVPEVEATDDGAKRVYGNTLIKGATPHVYVFGQDRAIHLFPSEAVFRSWHRDFSEVKTLTSDEMAKFTRGRDLTFKPGTVLSIKGTNRAFFVSAPGKIQLIPDRDRARVVNRAFGVNKQVVEWTDLSRYQETRFPSGSVEDAIFFASSYIDPSWEFVGE